MEQSFRIYFGEIETCLYIRSLQLEGAAPKLRAACKLCRASLFSTSQAIRNQLINIYSHVLTEDRRDFDYLF
jgi:hypothetical protein